MQLFKNRTHHLPDNFITMKRILFSLFAASALFLTGCLETTQEITLKEDGTGTYVYTNDMGKVLGILKNMGVPGMENLPAKPKDTTVALGTDEAVVAALSAEDRELVKKGSLRVNMDMAEEKFISATSFGFSSLSEIPRFNKLTGNVLLETLKGQAGGNMPMGMDQMPEPSSFDDYYTLEFEKGELKKKLNKEKYAGVANDQFLTQLQEAAAMGIPITHTYIINLPKPAEKLEGKNAKLSEDKMKVTVTSTIDDFFDNPENLEFKVKY